MKSAIGTWTVGLAVSALVHLGVAAGLMAALQPEPIADQPMPESRLNVDSQQVERQEATEQAPATDTAETADTSGASLGLGALAQSRAAPLPPPSQSAPAIDAQSASNRIAPTPADAAKALPAAPPVIAAAVPVRPKAVQATMAEPVLAQAAQAQIIPAALTRVTPDAAPAARKAPPQTALPEQAPTAATADQRVPEMTASKAVLAFPASGPVDPVSLAAFQSFTQPDDAAGTDVRDSLTAALQIPCSRMQVIFDPDTTTLKLTGHLPDPAQRAPMLAALQSQMGSDIAVEDNLLILPAPQCGALSGIAQVGLPQSTDQITNPMIVGADTHARAFRYETDDPLVLELTAPDYPAFVYVDYFDAGGNVIHLAPNDRAPLQFTQPKAALQIGARNQDAPGLFVRIGPPYGQEIAAAFASSVPLYEGLRPLVEPADAYLEWLRTKVAEARAAHPDFKGEWVYFFVTTAAK